MFQDHRTAEFHREIGSAAPSRRKILTTLFGMCPWLCAAAPTDGDGIIRLAISESVVGDVNLNDARAAMSIWIKRMTEDLNVVMDPKLFNTTQEILDRTRKGQLDAMAVNIIEYRQIAEFLDSNQIVTSAGTAGMEQYLLVVKQGGGVRQLADLKGRRLCVLKTPKMCVAPEWLFTVLEDAHCGSAEQLFGSITAEHKFSRVVLPVFFGQADACLTSKRGFDTMCELNPQVAKELKVIAVSPRLVVSFYIFTRNCQGANRQKVIRTVMGLPNSVAGKQLATLFQFENLGVQDAACLTGALSVLDAADRARARRSKVGRTG